MPSEAPNGNLKIMAYVKAIIAVMLIGTACACVLLMIEPPKFFVELSLGVIGVYFGFSALLYKQSADKTNGHLVNVIKLVVAEEVAKQLAARHT